MADDEQVDTSTTATRRSVLRGALVAGVATPLLAACGSSSTAAGGGKATSSGKPSGGGSGNSGGGGQASGGGGGGTSTAVAKTTNIPKGSGLIVEADGVVITQPSAGQFQGFSSTCTHAGCPLHDVTDTINCICHGSQFSIDDGSVVTGPATQPLPEMPIVVSGTEISLA